MLEMPVYLSSGHPYCVEEVFKPVEAVHIPNAEITLFNLLIKGKGCSKRNLST